MAGHSQFKNIMYRKGAQDAKRAKLFAKFGREITVAAKMGLPDPKMNPRLRAAMAAARAESMPRDNIERALKRATATDTENFDEMRYEGYGAGGVAIIVEALTDNKNRTAPDVRSYFSKTGGNLAETGAVSFMFDHLGLIEYPISIGTNDEMLEAAIEAGADDCISEGETHSFYCAMDSLHEVASELEKKFGEPAKTTLTWKPQNIIQVDDENGEKLMKLLDMLDDHDDIQNVYYNFEVSEELMKKLGE